MTDLTLKRYWSKLTRRKQRVDPRLKLVQHAIDKSFAGKVPIGSTIRGFVLNGEPIPDFATDDRGNIILL